MLPPYDRQQIYCTFFAKRRVNGFRWLIFAANRSRRAEYANLRRTGLRMIKSELVQIIVDQNPHLFQKDVERVVSAIFDSITRALERGDRVELRGFGAFSVKQREARTGRNPRTGEPVAIEQKWTPVFKPGKDMRERLDRPSPPESMAAE